VAERAFRSDLYFRLNGLTIDVPALRERVEDLEPLARHFLEAAAVGWGRRLPELSEAARAALHAYHWPGNVRELKNVIERALALTTGDVIGAEHVPIATGSAAARASEGAAALAEGASWRERMGALEREAILDALGRCAGNQTRAAELLGMPRRTFCEKLKANGVPRPRSGS
jgi:DNA-binding NtrC family response regulator